MTRARALALAISFAAIALAALAWLGSLDRLAGARTEDAFERALVTFAVARTLNGVISVAQGTEIAVEPGGVGVVLSPGQILDPLNDLVEDFSQLALLAATSLGIQKLLCEFFATPLVNALASLAAIGLLVALWRREPGDPWRRRALKIAAIAFFVRFGIAAIVLAANAVSDHYLAAREQASIDFLQNTRSTIERTADAPAPPIESDSTLDRLQRFIDESQAALDIRARLERLKADADAAIGHVVDLIVVYAVETLLLPLAFLALGWRALRLGIRSIA